MNYFACAAMMRHVSGLILLLAISGVSAQEQQTDSLDEIVVTVTRIESSIRDVARSISLVGKDRIQIGTQQLGLDEVLAVVPGLYMQNRYNFAQDLRISLRGFGARSSFGIRGIRVIVDGIPETLPDGQAQVDSIDLGSARRIEVLRGPASSLYGNASGGVIAIESELGDQPMFVEGRIAGGEFDYQKYQFKAGGLINVADYLLNVSRTEIDGYRDNSRARGTMINAKLGIPLNDRDRLTFVMNHTDQPDAQDPGGINATQAVSAPSSARDRNVQFDAGESLSQQRIGVIYKRDRPGANLMLRNYYVWRDFANKLPFVGGGAVDLERFFWGVGAQYSLGDVTLNKFVVTFGVDIDRQNDDRRRFDNNTGVLGGLVFDQRERVDNTGIYVQGRYQFDESWALLAGLRYDELSYNVTDRFLANGDDSGSLNFDEISPSLAVNYEMDSGVLFASYSSSFETPTTTELANPDASGGFNQALRPQQADNFELGYKRTHGEFYFEVAVFQIDLKDELIPFELQSFPGRTFYSNAGNSDRTGVETAFNWTSGSGLRLEASYTYSDFKFDDFVDDNGNDFSGNTMPGLPKHFGYLGLSYRADNGFSGTVEAIHSGNLYANNTNLVQVSSYTMANLRLNYGFRNKNWRIRPYLGLNNLFDEKYNSNIRINAFGGRFFEPAPTRNFYAGVVITYQKSE